MRRALAVGLFGLFALGPRSARAECEVGETEVLRVERARDEFKRGTRHLERSKTDEAIAAFECSLRNQETLTALYNLALSYHRLGCSKDARTQLDAYVELAKKRGDRARLKRGRELRARVSAASERGARPCPRSEPTRDRETEDLVVAEVSSDAAAPRALPDAEEAPESGPLDPPPDTREPELAGPSPEEPAVLPVPAAPAAPKAAQARPAETRETVSAPLTERWWFWVAVGAVVVVGVGAGTWAARGSSPELENKSGVKIEALSF